MKRVAPVGAPSHDPAVGTTSIEAAFAAAREEGRAALMPYLMGGFPDQGTATAIAQAYADAGADLIELGVPFSDPLADGPVIHAAATAALEAGATLDSVLETCAAGRRSRSGCADVLREHGPGDRRGRVRRQGGRRGRSRGDRPGSAARGAGLDHARPSPREASPWFPWSLRPRHRSGAARSALGQGDSSISSPPSASPVSGRSCRRS